MDLIPCTLPLPHPDDAQEAFFCQTLIQHLEDIKSAVIFYIFLYPGTDISATMPLICVKFCMMVERCSRQVFPLPFCGNIFRVHEKKGQKWFILVSLLQVCVINKIHSCMARWHLLIAGEMVDGAVTYSWPWQC